MKKASYKEFLETASMFFVDADISCFYQDAVNKKIMGLRNGMQDIHTRDGLITYIENVDEAIDNIILLLNVSSETFKRIISMFRREHGQEFSTEWSLSQTQKYFKSHDWMKEKVCNLFLNGAEDESLAKLMPSYTLNSFRINEATMARLKNDDTMMILIQRSLDATISSKVSNTNLNKIGKEVKKACETYGLKFETRKEIKIENTKIAVPYIIVDADGQTKAYIMYNFSITTGSGQSNFNKNIKRIKKYRDENERDADIIVVVDGAGWLARQGDLRDVYDYADYCLNLSSLSDIVGIIEESI